MKIIDAWEKYNIETDLLYSTPHLFRPFQFLYLYVFTNCYK